MGYIGPEGDHNFKSAHVSGYKSCLAGAVALRGVILFKNTNLYEYESCLAVAVALWVVRMFKKKLIFYLLVN